MATPTSDSYTALSGEIVRGGRTVSSAGAPAYGVSNLAAVIGDSLTEHNYGSTPIYWQLGRLGGPLDLIANSGHSGQSVFGLIGQIENSYRAATAPGLIGLPALGWLGVRIGSNGVRDFAGTGPGQTLTSGIQTNYTDLFNRMKDFAQHLIVFPIPPIGGVSIVKNTQVPIWNAWLKSVCDADPRMHWIDDCTDMVDGSGNIIPEYFKVDELHMTGPGSYQMGLTAKPLLEALFANQAYGRAPLVISSADIYPAQPQWTTNPTNVGTGGTFGTGWSGSLPTGWRVDNNGGSNIGVSSIVAADVGDTNTVPWVRLTPSVAVASNISVTMTGAGRYISDIDPDTMEQLIEVRFNGLRTFSALEAWAQSTGNKFTKVGKLYWSGTTGADGTVVLRQRFYRFGTSVGGTPSNYIYIGSSAAFSGAMGSIDIRCWSVRG